MSALVLFAEGARRRAGALREAGGAAALREAARRAPPPRGFAAALRGPGLRVIAEIKRASPSEGPLAPGLDPAATARAYEAAGAAALSVLTEPDFFAGAPEHLSAARAACALPVLMKDFVVDEAQLWSARALGADAALLIAALLGPRLAPLLAEARALGLDALVEVHDEAELSAARAAGAGLIGINNRDLRTLKTDLGTARRLAARPDFRGALFVCESGLSRREELEELSALGYGAFLIGGSLVKTGRPGPALAGLLGRGAA